MPKKAVILLGSPKRNGNSETLASHFASGAAEAGFKTQTIWVTGLKIAGCMDCRRCWTNGIHCFLNDDMKEIYAAVDKASVIAFATPLYFYSWSSQIKPVWDRLLPYFSPNSKISLKGRRSVLLATAGDDKASAFDGLKKSYELACGYAGFEIAGKVLAYGVHEAGAIERGGDWLDKAYQLGGNLK
jgi:multimeric flavodoxin WrbA